MTNKQGPYSAETLKAISSAEKALQLAEVSAHRNQNNEQNEELTNPVENDNVIFDYIVSLSSTLSTTNSIVFLTVNVYINVTQPPRKQQRLLDCSAQALLDSGAIAGDFISQDLVDRLGFNSEIIHTKSKKVCSGLDNSCNQITGSLSLRLDFINEISKIKETILFNHRILSFSPIDIIIGRQTLKSENLVFKNPSHFFSVEFIKNNSFFSQDASVKKPKITHYLQNSIPMEVNDFSHSNSSLVDTDTPETSCTDHECGCQRESVSCPVLSVSRTGAHKNKVSVITSRLIDACSEPDDINMEVIDACSDESINPPLIPALVGFLEEDNTSLSDTV